MCSITLSRMSQWQNSPVVWVHAAVCRFSWRHEVWSESHVPEMTEHKTKAAVTVFPRLTDWARLGFCFANLLRDSRWEAENRGSGQWCRCVLDYTPEGGPSQLHTPCEASQTRSETFTSRPSSHPTELTSNTNTLVSKQINVPVFVKSRPRQPRL